MPLTASSLSGQTLYLCTRRDPQAGYKLRWEREGSSAGMVTLMRKERTIGVYHFILGARTRAQIERRGDLLIISVQQLDPADSATDPAIVRAQVLHVFRDSSPLPTDQLGMTVTPGSCPAAALQVLSDRRQDAFELSPVDWATQNGVWKVMARYTCQPQWNWFGGFGGGLPAAWNKYRLTGDQNVEVYLGVKMQYDDRDDDEKQRFRDLNLSICAQPAQPESGYSVVRAHIEQGVSQTMLLRNGVVVQTSKKQADLLPTDGSGHREWFAARIEKHGADIEVFLDNHLAFSYTDPQPLAGGYFCAWTRHNGILIGRVNYSAQQMTLGDPL
jgi:hypothetical protein